MLFSHKHLSVTESFFISPIQACYAFTVLPLRLSLGPRTCLCAKVDLARLRISGMRILIYIDDWLIIDRSKEKVWKETPAVCSHTSHFWGSGRMWTTAILHLVRVWFSLACSWTQSLCISHKNISLSNELCVKVQRGSESAICLSHVSGCRVL